MRHREIASVMTPADRVVSVELGARYKDIAKMLDEHRISAVPVVDAESHVLGVVSEADILARGARLGGTADAVAAARADDATALDVMTAPAVTVTPDTDVVRAAQLMGDRRLKRLIVTDEEDHLLGVVSRHDILRYFDRTDADIRSDIMDDVLLATLDVDPKALDVHVEDGVVRLRGRVKTRNLGEIVGLVVHRLDGVVDVVNELDYDRDDTEAWP